MTWRDVQLVFQDADGCLNPPQSYLPDGVGQTASREQARMLREIGRAMDDSCVSQVVLNTGRGSACVDFVIEELRSSKIRYLLAEHGAIAIDTADGTHIDLPAIARRDGPPERAAGYTQLDPIRDVIAWYTETGEAKLSKIFGCPLPALPKFANLTLMIPNGLHGAEVS
jgi:hypothetical protein